MLRTIACSSTLITLLTILFDCQLASAQQVVINAMHRGWLLNGGDWNAPFLSTNNYFAGDAAQGGNASEYRNFFFFDLSGVSQPITSAKLVLSAGSYDSSAPSENYELHDVTTSLASMLEFGIFGGFLVPVFNDFGSGVFYGSRIIKYEDPLFLTEIELNSSAIAAMNATDGLFGIGGSVTTLDTVRNSEGLFGFTRSSQYVSELRLTLVPEPSSVLLLAIGAISLLGYRKRTR